MDVINEVHVSEPGLVVVDVSLTELIQAFSQVRVHVC
ncbi:DUF6207 family protein [Streptomyces sp. NPDC006743]